MKTMNCILICLVTLTCSISSQAQMVNVPVICDGMEVGNIIVSATGTGGISGGFFANTSFPTLADIEKQCNEDHFNWLQILISDTDPPVDAGGKRLKPPYLDPPLGGYGDDPLVPGDGEVQWADKLSWYYDEGPDPAPGTPGFTDGLSISDNTFPTYLFFFDKPSSNVAGTKLSFLTLLASVNADGSQHSLHGGFEWTWENGTVPSVKDIRRAVPEPSTIFQLSLGSSFMVGLILVRRKRS